MAGRKPLAAALEHGPQLDPDKLAERRQALVAAHEAGEMPTRETIAGWVGAAMHIGRIQAATVASKVSERVIAESYRSLAESKTYIGIPHPDPARMGATVTSMDEFCRLFLGKSQRRCQEIASNLDVLGAELYEAAEQIGLGQRDYNALRALPADEQVVVKAALEEGADRAAVVGLINDLAQRLADARQDHEAAQRKARERLDKISELQDQLSDATHFLRTAAPQERAREMLTELAARYIDVRASIGQAEDATRAFFAQCDEHGVDMDAEVSDRAVGIVNALLAWITELRLRGIDAPCQAAIAVLAPGR